MKIYCCWVIQKAKEFLCKIKFSDFTEEKMFTKIKEFDPNKASMEKDILAKILIGTNNKYK